MVSLSIDPSPIRIPGNVSIGVRMNVMRELGSPAAARITINKRITFLWIDLPCVDDFGSCDYDDLCTLWPFFQPCPSALLQNNIPCSCPFHAGMYDLPQQDMLQVFPDSSLPPWLESGSYWAQIILFDSQQPAHGSYLCNEIYASIYATS